MKRSLLILLVLICVQGLHAEEKKGFWDRGLGKFLKKVDKMVQGWEESGVDTNYIRRFEKDRFFYLGGYSYYQQHDMDFPVTVEKDELPQEILDTYSKFIPSNFEDNCYVSMDMHTIQAELELGIDWRGITLELPIPIRNKYNKSFGLAKNGSVWGFRIRFKDLNRMTGTIDNALANMQTEIGRRYSDYMSSGDPSKAEDTSPFQSQKRDIPDEDISLRIFYVEGYYVFNHKHFCLSAGAYGDMRQLRPAGSLFAWLNYFQSRIACDNTFNSAWDSFRNNKVSVGLGYGYNIPFLKGKGCVHMSIIPMFSVYNHLTHKNAETDKYGEEISTPQDLYSRHFYDAATFGKDSGFSLNGLAKFAVSYSHKRFVYNILLNYRQFMFNTSSKFHISDREADFQLNIGYRF